MKSDILITNCMVLEYPSQPLDHQPKFIAIENGTISAVDHMKNIGNTRSSIHLDGHGQLAMSGLINGHCHAPMTLFRGLADDLKLTTWLNDHIFPAEAKHVTAEMAYWCSKLAAAEMLLGGITTVADGYFHEREVTQAFLETGIRSVPAQGIIDFPAPGVSDPNKNIEAAAEFIDEFIEQYPLVTPSAFAHSPYTCSNNTLMGAKKMTTAKGTKLFIHLAETQDELDLIADPKGKTPVQHLEALGLLDSDTVCIHCVWVNDTDIDILAKNDCGVIICPQSHLKLSSGISPFPKMLEKGLKIGLGTDGPASNNGLDMFQEMDTCGKVQKLHSLNPMDGSAQQVLASATFSGAKAIGLPENIGALQPGNVADLILIDTHQPHLQPFYSSNTIVYSGDSRDVKSVIVNGKLVVENRRLRTIDLEETKNQVRILAQQVGGTR